MKEVWDLSDRCLNTFASGSLGSEDTTFLELSDELSHVGCQDVAGFPQTGLHSQLPAYPRQQ